MANSVSCWPPALARAGCILLLPSCPVAPPAAARESWARHVDDITALRQGAPQEVWPGVDLAVDESSFTLLHPPLSLSRRFQY